MNGNRQVNLYYKNNLLLDWNIWISQLSDFFFLGGYLIH